jgi:TolA-binding protein
MRLLPFLAAVAAILPVAAHAQDVGARVGRLEAEMRAVQRKVFPGGAGQTVQPDITPPTTERPQSGAPSTSAINDLTQRVAALEDGMRDLTGQVEQDGHRLRELEDSFANYRRATDARLAAGAGAPPPATADASPLPPPRPDDTPPPPRDDARPSAGGGARADQIAALRRAPTDDPTEDAYLYGYRLWAGKFYPEAETQLKKVVANYPKSKRASYAQNLLGRSYLDDGKPSLASIAFYDNYKKMPDGDRAPDSLYYLAQSLMKLNKPADACKVYGELSDVYGSKVGTDMKANIAKGRAAARCK